MLQQQTTAQHSGKERAQMNQGSKEKQAKDRQGRRRSAKTGRDAVCRKQQGKEKCFFGRKYGNVLPVYRFGNMCGGEPEWMAQSFRKCIIKFVKSKREQKKKRENFHQGKRKKADKDLSGKKRKGKGKT
ncbi:MAG: hypothetical protein IJO65_10885 [Lachnospiraceae bacterium]|nr:hypothetical protein [Lachnospiraceae bacterium]